MRTWIAGILAAGLLGAAGASAAPAPPPVSASLPKDTQAAQLALRAEELQSRGKWAEAAAALEQAAQLVPTDWTLWDRAGWAWIDAEQAQKAVAAFQSARTAAPGESPVGGLLAAEYLTGQKEAFQSLLAADRAGDPGPRMLGLITAGLAAKTKTPAWSLGLGALYARVLRNNYRAVGPLEDAARALPTNADVWLLLTEVNQELNRGPQEDAAAVKYLELAPATEDAYRLRAERYAAQQHTGEAISEYAAGIAQYPTAAELHFALARLYEKEGAAKSAEMIYRKLIAAAGTAKQPGLVLQARAQLANFQARNKEYAAAEAFYREAAARPDATAATWTTWGSLLAIQGKWPEASRALLSAADQDEKAHGSTRPSARSELLTERYHAAVCRLLAGGKGPCSTTLRAALARREETRSTGEIEARAFLSWCDNQPVPATELPYRKGDERWASFTWRRKVQGDEFDARSAGTGSIPATGWRAILQAVQKQYPDCWPAAYALSRIYATAGYGEEALGLLNGVARARTDWWAPYYALGQLYVYRLDKDQGVPILQRVLQLAPECRQARLNLQLLTNAKDPDDE